MVIKIIIVEDENILALDLKQRLKLLGHEVIGIAATGADALKLVKNNEVDLIFMDIHLKEKLNGIETALLIKEEFDIPIIYNSANFNSNIINELKKTENYKYLTKPFDDIQLQNAIKSILKL